MTIERYLLNKGMKPNLMGFGYAIRAIELCRQNKNYLRELTKTLYPQIANENAESPSHIERTLRYCISKTKCRMSIGEFVATSLIELNEQGGEVNEI